jgi:hypothetical protein
MIDNDLKDKCLIDSPNKTIEQSMRKIDYYLKRFSSFDQKNNLAKVRSIHFRINLHRFFLYRNFFHLSIC